MTRTILKERDKRILLFKSIQNYERLILDLEKRVKKLEEQNMSLVNGLIDSADRDKKILKVLGQLNSEIYLSFKSIKGDLL